MKNYFTFILILSLIVPTLGQAVSTDEIKGYWLTQKKDSIVEVFSKEGELYGKVVWLKDINGEDGKPQTDFKNPDKSKQKDLIMGLEILKKFTSKGKNKWTGGTIYDPDNGKTYKCKMKIKDNVLHIRGYVGIPLLGRTEIWTRAELPKKKPE